MFIHGRIRIQYADPDPGGEIFEGKNRKNARKMEENCKKIVVLLYILTKC